MGHDSVASDNKITQLTLELGEQRQNNVDLRKQLQDLCANFAAYKAGNLKILIEKDIKEKREGDLRCSPGDATKNKAGRNQISTSPA